MQAVARPDIGLPKRWFQHGLHSGNRTEYARVRERNLKCAVAARRYTSNAALSEIALRAKERDEIAHDKGVPANRPVRLFHVVVEPSGRCGDSHGRDNASPPPFIKERL